MGKLRGKLLEMRQVTVVALACILNASGGAWSLDPDPTIFLNIDCGAALEHNDAISTLPWHTDDNYISTGASSSNVRTWNFRPQLDTLRYFNDTRYPKYCYKLPVKFNSTYMLRAEFFYGSYDGESNEPTFQMTLDGLLVANVSSNNTVSSYHEITYVAKGNTTFLCLLRDHTNSNPYISGIVLRRVDAYPLMYTYYLLKGFMASTRRRYSFGYSFTSSETPRYPDDLYDRYWESVDTSKPSSSNPLNFTTPLQVLNTTKSSWVYLGGPAFTHVPPVVLQSAVASSSSMKLTLYRVVGDTGFLILHFAELDPAVNATSRKFMVRTSSGAEVLVNPFNQSLTTHADATGWMFNLVFESDHSETVDFIPTSDSVYGPIVNAAEFFEYINDTSRPSTLAADALAIDGIKIGLGLGAWTGDPCVPVPHTWVICSTVNPPTIESVNLSNYSLVGTIPAAFADLQTLTTLNLSGNNLEGGLPDLSHLTNLQILDLQGNNLNGSLPDWLGNLKSLTGLYVQNNQLTGTIPQALSRTGLTFEYQPGNTLVWSQAAPHPHKSNIGVIVGPVIGGAVAVIAAAMFILYCCFCKERRSNAPAGGLGEVRAPNPGGARSFSAEELTVATEDFNREIGRGGFGSVYYGTLPNGSEIAVKVLGNALGNEAGRQGATEFCNEIDVLSRVHHINLVSLLGFCNETDKQMLVYEYLPQGSLRDRLNASGHLGVLDFKARLNVALNAAQGLEYLHTGCNPCIVHRDVKSSNRELTNTKDSAKVADFGLSKLFQREDGSVTIVKGTLGYIDPEYMTTHYLTSKSDVYSFGVVLLELLTGRLPLPSASEPPLCDWVRRTLQSGADTDMILDPSLHSSHPDKEAVWKLTDVAMMCVEPKSIHRPSMAEVVHELRSALSIEEANTRAAAHSYHHQQPRQHQPYIPTSSGSNSSSFNTSIPSWPAGR